MSRTNKLTVYVNDADRARIEREAEERDLSVSTYFMDAVEQQWNQDDTEALADQIDLEERIERMVADARDELLNIAWSVEQRNSDVADMTARAGAYSIANFELHKDEFDPNEARKAESLLTGSRRLREPISDHPDRNLGEDPEDEPEELTIAEEFFMGRGRPSDPDPDELDEYGLHPDEEYYDIKRDEAAIYQAQREDEDNPGKIQTLFAKDGRGSPTDREAEYLRTIPKDDRTSYQNRRLSEYRQNQRQWERKRGKIHRKARREHEERKRNSGFSGLFRRS